MLFLAKTSGCAFASSTVSGSSGQPGLTAVKPDSSKSDAHRSQLDGSNQRPCTNTTGLSPEAFARSTCAALVFQLGVPAPASIAFCCEKLVCPLVVHRVTLSRDEHTAERDLRARHGLPRLSGARRPRARRGSRARWPRRIAA